MQTRLHTPLTLQWANCDSQASQRTDGYRSYIWELDFAHVVELFGHILMYGDTCCY
jgi:hypothetical protein